MSPRARLAVVWCALALSAALAGCSGRRLPPGTPPPEYEPPLLTPWTPESAAAGAPGAPEHEAVPANSLDAGSGAELSLDAGPR